MSLGCKHRRESDNNAFSARQQIGGRHSLLVMCLGDRFEGDPKSVVIDPGQTGNRDFELFTGKFSEEFDQRIATFCCRPHGLRFRLEREGRRFRRTVCFGTL